MAQNFKLAVVGNGTSAVNALHALHALYLHGRQDLHGKVETTLFGKDPEATTGLGFAYGNVGGRLGNLTEYCGHADYHALVRGEFLKYAAEHHSFTERDTQAASRQLIGQFHAHRYEATKTIAEQANNNLSFQQGNIINLEKSGDGFRVIAENGDETEANHVALAIGDVPSTRFDDAIKKYPEQVFGTPYHAVQPILDNNGHDRVIVARGTRSSFVDLANGLANKGYEGRIIGVSTTGVTSWQAREAEPYPLAFLPPGNKQTKYLTVKHILSALKQEFHKAESDGCYVPPDLIGAISEQRFAITPQRLVWKFDLNEEARHAGTVTYHDVAMAVDWESLYCNLESSQESKAFDAVLRKFISYNRVNRIVPDDFQEFIDHFRHGRAEIRQGSFGQEDIHPGRDGKLTVRLAGGDRIDADYVVNCAIGPSSSFRQIESVPLLGNLAKKGWIVPQEGTGFISTVSGISFLGVQARPYSFSSIGLETNGRHIVDTWLRRLKVEIERTLRPVSGRSYERVCACG